MNVFALFSAEENRWNLLDVSGCTVKCGSWQISQNILIFHGFSVLCSTDRWILVLIIY